MKDFDIDSLVRPNILALSPYSTARDECDKTLGIFLDANESPWPSGWNRYPDPHQKVLKSRISEVKGVPAANIFVGNGSDEAIDVLMRVFCEPGRDNIVAICPSYGMYTVAAQINNVEVREVDLDEEFGLRADAMLEACDSNTKQMLVCSPNNPSGNAFSTSELLGLAARFNGLLVVDEAYTDFSDEPSLRWEACTAPNIVVLQTLSKAWGMAALRLGLCFATERVIGLMSSVKYPYNINAAAQKLALEQLERDITGEVSEIRSERVRLAGILPEFGFVRRVYRSDANFILVKVDDPDGLYAHLLEDGIIVRNRNKVRGCAGCLRITVGLKAENEKLIESLERYEKGRIC